MSPEQLKKLHELSLLFEEGAAGSDQIKELSELLNEINHSQHEEPLLQTLSHQYLNQ